MIGGYNLISFLLSALKIIFLLGLLIFIHESGHFLVAKFCKVKVNEFAIGFGPTIWKKQGKETKYALRLIPLGGFVNMEGEEQESSEDGSFSKASIPQRIAIVAAGAIVNITFGIIVFLILMTIYHMGMELVPSENNIGSHLSFAFEQTKDFIVSIIDNLKQLFTGKVGVDQMMGPVGISSTVAKTEDWFDFFYIISLISLSLGITNLLPIPALDGGKILLLIVEAIRKKPLDQKLEVKIQLVGFSFIIALSSIVSEKSSVNGENSTSVAFTPVISLL